MIERFFDIWNKYVIGNKEDFKIGLAQLEKEIRADERNKTIDECIKLVGGNTKTIVGIVFDNSVPIHDRALGRMAKNKLIEELVEQLEQLKEQTK